jgi:hypothetical protein
MTLNMEKLMQAHYATARAICLVVPIVFLAACSQDSERNAPVTTTTPAGQSSAPSAEAAEERDTALVRVVHAIPAGSSVDVYADDNRVFDKLGFKDVTPYKELDGQRYAFNLYPAGAAVAAGATGSDRPDATRGTADRTPAPRGTSGSAQRALASNSEGLDDGNYYTVFALPGEDGDAALLRVVEDRHERPDADRARVRVVNAAAETDEVDIFAQGQSDALIGGIDFQTVSDYDEVNPFNGALEVRAGDDDAPISTLPNIRLEAGKSYTVVVVGNRRRAPKLEAFVIEDVVGPPTTAARQ